MTSSENLRPLGQRLVAGVSAPGGWLGAGALLALRMGRQAAAQLRKSIWQQAQDAQVPCAWLEVGAAGTHAWRMQHLAAVPRQAWPVMGQAYDWPSAWAWTETWHRRLEHSWVVVEAEDCAPEEFARTGAQSTPLCAPQGLSVARERRLRALLRRRCGRIVALTT